MKISMYTSAHTKQLTDNLRVLAVILRELFANEIWCLPCFTIISTDL